MAANSSKLPKSVYLIFEVGDPNEIQSQAESYTNCVQFLRKHGAELGFPSHPDEIQGDESIVNEQIDTITELFATHPFSDKGTKKLRCTKPDDCRYRIDIDLFLDAAPKTCQNFVGMIQGGIIGKESKKLLWYKDCKVHRIEEQVIQFGDVVKGDGSAGESIFGGSFNDEKGGLALKHGQIGVVGMANSGRKNTNTSQVYITTVESMSHLNGKHVIFGQVTQGCIPNLIKVRDLAASKDGKPKIDVFIRECGIVP
mmetsp:Transcript_9306/g.16231  ORF Transcript_9306/g.16231 Transcript_9306/m.16231 type:complete len:255 (-) Transcript_9306:934-1698(-)